MSAIPVTDGTAPDPASDLHGWLATRDGLVVVPLHNPVLEALGHHPASAYADRYWVPTIGPTASLLHRKLAGELDRHPDGYPVHLPTLAREIGLGAGTGRNAPLTKSLARMVGFQLAEVTDGQFAVRPTLPPLSRWQAAHLPPHLAEQHRREAFVRLAPNPERRGRSVDLEL
ncbi:MAG: hypothetical protein AB1679_14390 [Actinomycetota bacterium]